MLNTVWWNRKEHGSCHCHLGQEGREGSRERVMGLLEGILCELLYEPTLG